MHKFFWMKKDRFDITIVCSFYSITDDGDRIFNNQNFAKGYVDLYRQTIDTLLNWLSCLISQPSCLLAYSLGWAFENSFLVEDPVCRHS